ncbi:zinc metalloprotease [Labrenzia sp. PHM005]|nr:zinc metalloprotease [Labrenzia sp. PHM005]
MEHHKYLAATNETYQTNRRRIETFSRTARLAERTSIVRIPVVVHILFNETEENISQSQIDSQIRILNEDYRAKNADLSKVPDPFKPFVADPMIEFALAIRDPMGNETTGITRTWTSMEEFPYDRFDPAAIAKLDSAIKHDEFGKAAWPTDRYLNMWVCNIEGGLLGYAQFPGGPAATDGVVINTTAFGSEGTANAPFNLGRTAVHEVGHYLDLLHIWGDDGIGCQGSDNVVDTPNQAGSNTGTPSFPKMSCNNGPHGDMFMNYMDYVNDAAMFMFTKGQVARMNAALAGPRRALTESEGLTPVGTPAFVAGDLINPEAMASRETASEQGEHSELMFDGVSWV